MVPSLLAQERRVRNEVNQSVAEETGEGKEEEVSRRDNEAERGNEPKQGLDDFQEELLDVVVGFGLDQNG